MGRVVYDAETDLIFSYDDDYVIYGYACICGI